MSEIGLDETLSNFHAVRRQRSDAICDEVHRNQIGRLELREH